MLPLPRVHTTHHCAPQRALGRPTVWGCEAAWWSSLRTLHLAGNALSDRGLCALLSVLPEMAALESLSLRQVGLTELSAPQLSRVMAACPALTDLDVGYNGLGTKAAAAIAAGLPAAKRLAKLSLAWNSLGGGVHLLSWALVRLGARHCALRQLDLAGTDLMPQVVVVVVVGLAAAVVVALMLMRVGMVRMGGTGGGGGGGGKQGQGGEGCRGACHPHTMRAAWKVRQEGVGGRRRVAKGRNCNTRNPLQAHIMLSPMLLPLRGMASRICIHAMG